MRREHDVGMRGRDGRVKDRTQEVTSVGHGNPVLEHDPEKWVPVFPRDKRGTRLRGDHAPIKTKGRPRRRDTTQRQKRGGEAMQGLAKWFTAASVALVATTGSAAAQVKELRIGY